MSFPNVTPENEEATMSSNKFKVGDTVLFRPRQHKNDIGPWDGPAQIVGRVDSEPWAINGWTVKWKGGLKNIFELDYEIEAA
jgi:hypothetical protein